MWDVFLFFLFALGSWAVGFECGRLGRRTRELIEIETDWPEMPMSETDETETNARAQGTPLPEHLHHCPVPGCPKRLPPHLLMCSPHWRLVPKDLQAVVYDAWHAKQHALRALDPRALVTATEKHVDVCRLAVDAVLRRTTSPKPLLSEGAD